MSRAMYLKDLGRPWRTEDGVIFNRFGETIAEARSDNSSSVAEQEAFMEVIVEAVNGL